LHTARAAKRNLFGRYYLVGRKELIENVDIEKLARDLKVLEPWESLGDWEVMATVLPGSRGMRAREEQETWISDRPQRGR
jgi:hypothetical protein